MISGPAFEYWLGGSLPLGAPSYVRRQADEDFYAGLKAGKFCYVLNSRQMGKSSLRVRTMARLQSEGVVCVAIDMTAIGSGEVTAEQWYLGVVWEIVKQVREQSGRLQDWRLPRVRQWWAEREGLSFVQRWGEFVGEGLLAELMDPLVIFVDEIDSVLGLGFRTDDFFAAIRELYNRRVDDPRYGRLTFALLGVCAPQDLIRDKRRTPFNVGQAVELTGFSFGEALGLAEGLPGGEATLQTVLDWTGGQPFLTQRACRLVAESPDLCSPFPRREIEKIIENQMIRVWESQDEQVHFQTIQDRVMAEEFLAGAILGLYQQILQTGRVGLDSSEELLALRLTGLVVKRGDSLVLANRIYQQVFGPEWVEKMLLALRPYGEEMRMWSRMGKHNAWLLAGDELKRARAWANEEGRKLTPEDYRFLQASQDSATQEELAEIQESLQLEQQEKSNLEASNRTARRRLIGIGSFFLAGSMGLAGFAGLLWNIADIRILSMTAQDASVEGDVQTALVKSMKAYQRFRPLGIGARLNLEPYQVTESEVLKALNTAVNQSGIQNVMNFVDPALKGRQQSHESDVRSVAFSPDGNTIASGSDDNTVKLWRRDGTLMTTLKGHEFYVSSVAFSPDGNTIASGSWDKTVKLWRRDGTLISTLKGHEDFVNSVAFSPDGNTIASGSWDKTVKLWRRDGTLISTLKGHESPVNSVAFSPDGNTIASGSWDRTVKLWRRDGTLLTTLKGHEGNVNSVAFSPDGNTIASGSEDSTVKLWRRDGTLLTTLKGHEGNVNSVAFSPDGNTIASASGGFLGDGTVNLWQRDGTLMTTLKGHEFYVSSVAFSPDGNTIASGSGDKTVKLWRRDGTLISTLKGHESSVNSVAFSPDGNTIASASGGLGGDETVKLWRRDGTLLTTLKGHEDFVNSVAFSPDGNTIASASGGLGGDETVKLWRRDGTLISTLKGHEDPVNSVAFSPDGNTIASGSGDKTVKLWRRDGTLLTTLKGHEGNVNSVAFSPDGNTIASGSEDSTVKLWRRDGTLISTLKGHESPVNSVAFSPDGNTIASGSWDNTVKLWRRDGTLLTTLKGHEGNVNSVAFSPDGNTIASGSEDSTVKLWRRDGTLISTLKGHESSVNSVAFSPDGNTIASGSWDNTVKLWPIRLSDFFAMGCYRIKDTINGPEIQGLKSDCAKVQSDIPPLLLIQARTTAEMGNYTAAKALLEEAKARDPKLSIDQPLVSSLRQTAAQAVIEEASRRISASQKSVNAFDRAAYLEETNFLLRRAKTINPDLTLEQALQGIQFLLPIDFSDLFHGLFES